VQFGEGSILLEKVGAFDGPHESGAGGFAKRFAFERFSCFLRLQGEQFRDIPVC